VKNGKQSARLIAFTLGVCAVCPPSGALAAVGGARAPSAPPLSTGGAQPAGVAEGAEGSPQVEADPLVSNGLGSPLCKGVLGTSELPPSGRRNCETSGFVEAGAPTGNYGVDVHIDTGVVGFNTSSAVQDLVIAPLWMALVWAVHAVVVMLEWCFTVDVLGGATASVGKSLREAQDTLTAPWLVIVLAIASILALYNGLIRRRVAETLGQAMLMGAMMVGGLWVIADPAGTVDALGEWANQASLGTLAVAARGTPVSAGGTLARSMDAVFAAAIEGPWCYLEFGDVSWCRSPARVDPRLHAAALKIAGAEATLIGCSLGQGGPITPCATPGSAQARSLEHSAELLREAQSNGAIFLALPANGPARNSINEQGSLLRTLCQSSEATNCRGPTAAQAEFRTASGTLARLGGLLLIAAGVLGMMMLLGFIALRLLAAAVFSLLYLLMAPGMVLAPALGDGGRAVFRKWAAQLLGAVVSKLLFAFLLGVVLAVVGILSDLQALGWWTQWLLTSAFWWSAYVRRHQALGLAEGAFGRERATRSRAEGAMPRALAGRFGDALDPPRKALGAARSTMNKLGGQAPSVEQRRRRAQAGRERARAQADAQVRRTLELEHDDARERAKAAPRLQRGLSEKRAQLQRVERARASAIARGDGRRAAELGHRKQRIEGEIERRQAQLDGALRVAGEGERSLRRTGGPYTRDQQQERQRFLDAQASLPAASDAVRSRAGESIPQRRDYGALAVLAGLAREQYEQLDPRARRAARLEIDRQLALRRELADTAGNVAAGTYPKLGRRERHKADREFEDALRQRMRDDGRKMPESRVERTAVDRWREDGRGQGPHKAGSERSSIPGFAADAARRSSVMRDAHEVVARRKRQLGRDRR
jgi:hypothetical protein